MNVCFTSDDPLNCTVFDGSTGRALYDVSTKRSGRDAPRTGVYSTTTIRDISHSPNCAYDSDSSDSPSRSEATDGGMAVASWERSDHNASQDRVTLRGETLALADWLHKRDVLSRTRAFVAPDGEEYSWRQRIGRSSTFKLVHTATHRPAAQSHLRQAAKGPESGSEATQTTALAATTPRVLALALEPAATHFLDAVLLSFVILEQSRREHHARTTNPFMPYKWFGPVERGS